jgi:hypothetical protein
MPTLVIGRYEVCENIGHGHGTCNFTENRKLSTDYFFTL